MNGKSEPFWKDSDVVIGCILMLLLIAGGIYSVYLGSTLRYWDETEYHTIAKNLSLGMFTFDGITPTAFSAPGYPAALYLLSLINSDVVFLRFFNFIFAACTVWLVYRLVFKYSTPTGALLAALLVAAYPLFFYTAGTLYSQAFSTLLLITVISLMGKETTHQIAYAFFSGLMYGLLMLVTPLFVVSIPPFFLYPWILKKSCRWKTAFTFLVAAALPVCCWSLRNYEAFDRFIMISTNSGVNFLLGNSEHTTPNSGVNADITSYLDAAEQMNEYERDAYFRRQAFAWIFAHPQKAFQLYVGKVINYFNFRNELRTTSEGSPLKDFISFVSYYPLLALFVVRLLLFKRFPFHPMELFLAFLYVTSAFFTAVFFVRIRFRLPFDILMIAVVAGWVGLRWPSQKEVTP